MTARLSRRDFVHGSLGTLAGTSLIVESGCRLLSDRRQAIPGPHRAIRIDHAKCSGCRTCEFICDEVHHPVLHEGKELAGFGNPFRSLIRIRNFASPLHVGWVCQGCPDLPCMRACDYYSDRLEHKKALHLDPATGWIRLDRESCAGCERCIEACAKEGAGVLRWDPTDWVVGACDLCGGTPRCVAECECEAIQLVDVSAEEIFSLRTVTEIAPATHAKLYGPEEP